MNRTEFTTLMQNGDIGPSLTSEEMTKHLIENLEADKEKDEFKQYGHRKLIVTNEELGELSQEICKVLRGKGDRYGVLEEFADVFICMEYIRIIMGFDNEEIEKAIDIKLKRSERRLKENGQVL